VTADEELLWIGQAQRGDRSAFALLVEQYWPRICRWLHGHVHHLETAEDITQNVFLKAWMALPGVNVEATLRPWLYTIARHCLIDHRRGDRHRAAKLPESLEDSAIGPVALVLQEEGSARLQAACENLPEHLRSAFLLWTHEQMPYEEIAHVLDITEPTARWRVCKARHLLLDALSPYLDQKVS
jgi:RNA polymerase sigma-70 factor, ECF subfamily